MKECWCVMSTSLGLCPLAHVHSTPTQCGYSTPPMLLGFASSGVHPSCFLLRPVSACRSDRALLRPHVPLQQLASHSLCNELLCHDVTASVPSTTFPHLRRTTCPLSLLLRLWYTPCAVPQLLLGIPPVSARQPARSSPHGPRTLRCVRSWSREGLTLPATSVTRIRRSCCPNSLSCALRLL